LGRCQPFSTSKIPEKEGRNLYYLVGKRPGEEKSELSLWEGGFGGGKKGKSHRACRESLIEKGF